MPDALDDQPLIPPRWIELVLDTIERLEERAEDGEVFAKIALGAWYRELARLERGEIY